MGIATSGGADDVNRIRILLVDDSSAFLCAVAAWLGRDPRIEVVGTARSARDAIEQSELLRPDLVLMDVSLSEMSGFDVTTRIKSGRRAPQVILMSFHASEAARREAWSAGADGLIAKSEITESLLPLVRNLIAARRGETAGRIARPNGPTPTSKHEKRSQTSTKPGSPRSGDP